MIKTATLLLASACFLVSAGALAAGTDHANANQVRQATGLVHQMAAGHYKAAEANFTDKMKKAAPPEKLEDIWRQLTSTMGDYESTGATKTTNIKGVPVVFVETKFKKAPIWAQVAFNKSGKLAGLYFRPPAFVKKMTGDH